MGMKLTAELFAKLAPSARNQLAKEMGDALSQGVAQASARFEAMQDLSRRTITGGSQAMIDQAGAIALEDAKTNQKLTKDKEKEQKKQSVQAESSAKAMQASQAAFIKNLGLMAGPLFNPTSIWSQMFAGRQGFAAFNTQFGQNVIGKFGMSGVGGALAATAIVQAAVTALGLSLKALEKGINEVVESFKTAKQIFLSGLAIGGGSRFGAMNLVTQQTLGMNAPQALGFGVTHDILKQTELARDILAKTAPELARVNIQFEIMLIHLKASAAQIANQLAPALESLANAITLLDKALIGSGFLEKFIQRSIAAYVGIVSALTGINPSDLLTTAATIMSKLSKGPLQEQTAMKQLPASSWERMGLILGGTGAVDYARRTALASERTNILLGGMVGMPRGDQTQFYNRP